MKLFSHFRPRRFAGDEAGAALVEYGIIFAGISVSVLAVLGIAGVDVIANLKLVAKIFGLRCC